MYLKRVRNGGSRMMSVSQMDFGGQSRTHALNEKGISYKDINSGGTADFICPVCVMHTGFFYRREPI